MSLRIYIKSTPKFNSPKQVDQPLSVSPQLNAIASSNLSRLSKRAPESKDPSVMLENSPHQSEHPLRSSADNSISIQGVGRRDIGMEPRPQHPKFLEDTGDDLELEKFTTEKREPRSVQEIQKAITDFNRRQSSRKNIPDRQLRDTISECDRMIATLLIEAERFHEVLADKNKDIEVLYNLNASLNKTNKELKTKISFIQNDDKSEDCSAAKQEVQPVVAAVEGGSQASSTLKKLSLVNTELAEEVALLREMGSTAERTLQKERDSYKWLKTKAEELINLNDDLNNRLREKEDRINTLQGDTHKTSITNEKLSQEIVGKNYMIEELKKSLVLVDFQSPRQLVGMKLRDELNGTVSLFPKEINATIWSTLKMESPSGQAAADKLKEDLKELQKRYENVKNDNGRLIKLVEGNQQTIKNLREAFVDFEKKSSARYSDVKTIYEEKIRILLERTENKIINGTETNNNTGATRPTAGVASSLSPSQTGHSKKASNESLSRERSDVPTAVGFYNNSLMP